MLCFSAGASASHSGRITAVPDRRRLLGNIAEGHDSVQAVILNDPDAVEPHDDLHEGQHAVGRDGSDGPESDPPLDAGIDHIVGFQNFAKDGLDDRIHVGVIEVQSDSATA
jgi:hypothetical protein